VAEQLAGDQRRRQGRAGNDQERPIVPGGMRVDEPGEVRLAGAGLAAEEHGDVVADGHLLRQTPSLAHLVEPLMVAGVVAQQGVGALRHLPHFSPRGIHW
jgi:hypothetical protein